MRHRSAGQKDEINTYDITSPANICPQICHQSPKVALLTAASPTWDAHTQQDAVVDDGEEAQDALGPLQLLGLQAQPPLAGRRHIGPLDHDLHPSPCGRDTTCVSLGFILTGNGENS